jgi:hypothetical protein
MFHYLLQTGNLLTTEKIACLRTDNKCSWVSYLNIFDTVHNLILTEDISKIIPLGSVEFCMAYSEIIGLNLPEDFSYGSDIALMTPFLKRKINRTTFALAKGFSFIKPIQTKLFTGDIKDNIHDSTFSDYEVWESEPIKFTAEFRFYIHNNKILGYSRYDENDCDCPSPELNMIQEIIKIQNSFPIAYSIDIGWRTDINEWCLVELNDA